MTLHSLNQLLKHDAHWCFTLVTDHKLLTTIPTPCKGILSLAAVRLQQWAIILSLYQYQIEHKCTKDHGNTCCWCLPDTAKQLGKSTWQVRYWVKSDISPNLVGPKGWRVVSSPTGTGDMNTLLKVTVPCGAYEWLCWRSCRMRCWGTFIERTKALLGWKQLRGVVCGGLVWTSAWKMLPRIAKCAS